ncbi:MAG: DNA polymerase III subunit alpha [Chitinivibrionales bacterium]|nr:DNA polymerase III subunit alpha [Chitinivibrionales bacterium]
MTNRSQFVHLHTHSEYSFLDGAIRIHDLVKAAVDFGMPAVALTDHGGLFGAIEFYETCVKMGIKPILGFEAYVAPDSRFERTSIKEAKSDHLVLLAKNEIGWKNLMRLSTIGYLEGFYYKPRIDIEALKTYHEGIIASSACIGGAIPRAILSGDEQKARALAQQYLSIFGDGNFYFEIQNHGIDEEIVAFEQIIGLSKSMGVPLIVTNDAHYLKKQDSKAHDVLLCIETQAQLSDPNRYRFSSDEIYFKSTDEMAALFPDLPEALSNTIDIAQRCSVKVYSSPQLPVPELPQGFSDADDYLRTLALGGLEEKYPAASDAIRERFDYELSIIQKMGFTGYFLIIRGFLHEADTMGILRGCRGSAAGSIIAYCIGITNVDPIKYDLLFERFLNPERISMPDIDVDVADYDRYKLIDYIVQKYGRDCVCQIINFGRMKAKAVVKDVARVMGIPIAEANKLSSMIEEKTLQESISSNKELASAIAASPQLQELVTYATVLEGLVRQPGMHAGGVIIAPDQVVNWSPLFRQSRNDSVMTQFDMKYVESVGLIKMDLLGLRTLTVLQEACHLIEQYHNVKINLWSLSDGDQETYKLFHGGETTDIFQFESQGMQDYLRKLKPTCIEDLIAMTSLYRPGPMANIDSFIHRKHGKEKIEYPHPMLKEILDVTYGIIVYQEQVMRIAQKMGGFSLGQADAVRKAMGKKQIDKMESMRKKFIEGALSQNIKQNTAEEVWALMSKFAEYGFNKAHATVYAHVSYQAAFLKAHYPREYMTAVLTSHIGEKEKFLTAKNEAERLSLSVLAPDINMSDINCSIAEGKIRLGLSVIANIGKAAEAILKSRTESGLFTSIFDLCSRVDLRIVNKKALESLIMAGALDCFRGTRSQFFAAVDAALDHGQTAQRDRQMGQTNLFEALTSPESPNAQKKSIIAEPELPMVAPWPYNELLMKERQVLNFYMSGHPLNHYKDEIEGFSTISLIPTQLEELKDSASVVIGGMITSVKKLTQRNGKQMAFCELEDFNSSIELVIFAEAFSQYGHLCAVDAMVLIRGTAQKKEENNPKIIVEKILPLNEARERLTRSVHLRLQTQGLEEEFLKEIISCCNSYRGECMLVLHVTTSASNEYTFNARTLRLSPSKEMVDRIRTLVGRENVWLSQKGI